MRLKHDPEKLQTFRTRSCDEQVISAKWRFDLIPFRSSSRNHRSTGFVIARRRSRRSNPESMARALDCFATLAMTLVALYHQIAIPGVSRAGIVPAPLGMPRFKRFGLAAAAA